MSSRSAEAKAVTLVAQASSSATAPHVGRVALDGLAHQALAFRRRGLSLNVPASTRVTSPSGRLFSE